MVDVTIYIRDINEEERYANIKETDPDNVFIPVYMAVATTFKCKIQSPPYYSISYPGPFSEWHNRYVNFNQEDSDSLSHLEEIANGFKPEQEALLYVNDSFRYVNHIALNILRYGRSSVIWKYELDLEEIHKRLEEKKALMKYLRNNPGPSLNPWPSLKHSDSYSISPMIGVNYPPYTNPGIVTS